jgi:predicted nucleotidyltransferase
MEDFAAVPRCKLDISKEAIAEFCRRNGIRRLGFYGSVLRDDFGPESDVDVLVEFEPGQVVGFRIVDIEEELSLILGGRKVDMVNPKYLNRRLKDRILASAEVQYGEG